MLKKPSKIKYLFQRENTNDFLMLFFRQFSEMIRVGIPIYHALKIMGAQFDNTRFGETIEGLKHCIYNKGFPLYRSMSMFPKVFSSLCVATVKAGEEGGFLPEILKKLAKETEQDNNLRKRLYSIMTYPITLIVISIIVIMATLKFILPSFTPLLNSFNAKPPVGAKVLNYIVAVFNNPITIFTLILLAIFLNLFFKTPKGSIVLENFLLELPIIGGIIRYTALIRFSRMYAILADTRFPLIGGLQLVSESLGCDFYKKAITRAIEEVKQGEYLSIALSNQRAFPPLVISMISVGEESGNMNVLLNKLAHLYEVEIETTMEKFFTLLEPILVIFLGIMVGIMIISVFLPVYEIISKIG